MRGLNIAEGKQVFGGIDGSEVPDNRDELLRLLDQMERERVFEDIKRNAEMYGSVAA